MKTTQQYCLYLVLSQEDEQQLLQTILKVSQSYPKTWGHYQKKGFHFQLTQWSLKDFNILEVQRTGCLINKPLNAIAVTRFNQTSALSFQSFEIEDLLEILEKQFCLPVISNPHELKGFISYTQDMPDDTTYIKAAKFILNSDWYLVKVSRTGPESISSHMSNPFLWRHHSDVTI